MAPHSSSDENRDYAESVNIREAKARRGDRHPPWPASRAVLIRNSPVHEAGGQRFEVADEQGSCPDLIRHQRPDDIDRGCSYGFSLV